MTLRDFPPADQCTPEDLDAIADLVVSDPRASYDLAGSREHIEALCRRHQVLQQEHALLEERNRQREQARERLGQLASELLDRQEAAARTAAAMERALAAATNDLDAARTEIKALASTLDAERNERQGEVLAAEADRERADTAEALVEVHEAIARSALALVTRTSPVSLDELVHAVNGRLSRALVCERKISAALGNQLEHTAMLLEQQAETRRLDDALRSTCSAVTGQTIETVNIQLDAELAAHPDPGPLHHARDQREPDEPIIRSTLDAALVPCEHRTDVPCAGCEMRRRRKLFNQEDTTP